MTSKISFRDTSNIYNGCLNHIKSSLTPELPKEQILSDNGLNGIIGSPEFHDVCNTPWGYPPAWVKINLGKYFIFPTAYSLMGRRHPQYTYYLTGWSFFGKNHKGNWTLLSTFSNSQFKKGEIRTFDIKAEEPYNSFMIQMTQPDSMGCWALCLGQIEVFGDILTNYKPQRIQCKERYQKKTSVFLQMILVMIY